jgi:hypothetical protein
LTPAGTDDALVLEHVGDRLGRRDPAVAFE